MKTLPHVIHWGQQRGEVMKTQRRWAFLALALVPMLALLGCGEAYSGSGYRTSSVATSTPTLGGLAGAYYEAAQAEQELERAAAEATASAANSALTVQAAQSADDNAQAILDAAAAATSLAVDHNLTVQASNLNATAQTGAYRATATAQMEHATATAQASMENATATAQANDSYATATAQAQRATATVESQRTTATSEARHMTAAAVAYNDGQTATADALNWTATARAVGLTATADAFTATAQARASDRERLTHPLRTYGPWMLMVVVVMAVGYVTWRFITVIEIRLRALKRDARGDAPIYASGDGRAITLYDPDRNFWAGATIIDGQVIEVYETAPSASHQARLVAGDQAIDLVTRGPLDGEGRRPFTRRQRTNVAQRLLAPPPQPQAGIPGLRGVRVLRSVGQATSAGVIPPALAGSIEKDWIEGEWTEV